MEDILKKEIPSLPGYFCDIHGNVYHGDKMLTIGTHNGNFGYVALYGKWNGSRYQKKFTVARLMGETWLDATPNDTICFYDGNNTNLALDNLYIGTKGDFHKSLIRFRETNEINDGRLSMLRRKEDIYLLDNETFEIISEYSSIMDAADEFNISPTYIYKSCISNASKIYNMRWCFKSMYDDVINSLTKGE